VVTVTETPKGIKVRQDRFLATGLAEGKDNETIWCDSALRRASSKALIPVSFFRSIPLSILTVDSSGKTTIDKTALLDTREKEISLDINNTFKLNAGTNGVCKCIARYRTELCTDLSIQIAFFTPVKDLRRLLQRLPSQIHTSH